MIQLDTLGAGRRLDRGIRTRGAVVAANRTGHAGGDGDDHQLMVNTLEAGNHDGDQDTESTPGCTGRECQETADQEYECGQEAHDSIVAGNIGDEACNIILRAERIGHGLQGPCKGQDQDRGDHALEAFGKGVHTFLESQ